MFLCDIKVKSVVVLCVLSCLLMCFFLRTENKNTGKDGLKISISNSSLNEYVAAGGASSSSAGSKLVLEEVLEEAPKWKLLRVSE